MDRSREKWKAVMGGPRPVLRTRIQQVTALPSSSEGSILSLVSSA